MHYVYNTKGTCSSKIEFDLIDGKVYNVKFTGGCNGNLQAVSKLVEGLSPEEIKEKCGNILCGFRKTSCPDQLAHAVIEAMEEVK